MKFGLTRCVMLCITPGLAPRRFRNEKQHVKLDPCAFRPQAGLSGVFYVRHMLLLNFQGGTPAITLQLLGQNLTSSVSCHASPRTGTLLSLPQVQSPVC